MPCREAFPLSENLLAKGILFFLFNFRYIKGHFENKTLHLLFLPQPQSIVFFSAWQFCSEAFS